MPYIPGKHIQHTPEDSVSWFNNLLDKLFGHKKQHIELQQTPRARAASTKAETHTPVEVKTACPPNTLGYVLKNSPAVSTNMHTYNLQNPPPLHKEACKQLQLNINRIPPMPEIWHRVQDILQQDDASASDLGKCIANDPVLTAKILQVCNSSIYAGASGEEVSNIPLAIARLGLDETSSIIFRSLAPDLGESEQHKMEIRHIWFHSQAIAMLSRILAEPSRHLNRHDATLMGMLHDIGKLVILHIEPEQQLGRLKAMIDKGMSSLASEQEVLGYTHIDAGRILALHWRLPKLVQQSIAFHHHPAAIKAANIPASLRHAMLTLHVAHLILQYHIESEDNAGERLNSNQPENTSVWQSHQRTCLHDTLRFVQQEMLISLDRESLLRQMMVEIQRLKLSFPDIFPIAET